MMAEVLDLDPAGGILAFRSMLRGLIAMPGRLMDDGRDPDLFDHFAVVAQRTNVYTVRDYASIIEHLVKAWDIAGRSVTGEVGPGSRRAVSAGRTVRAAGGADVGRAPRSSRRGFQLDPRSKGVNDDVAANHLGSGQPTERKDSDTRVLMPAPPVHGRALIPLLQHEGHSVMAWVRSETRARSMLGAEVELVPADAGFDVLVRAIERCDAVVNLAGEPLMGGRWTAARRAILESSRVDGDRPSGARDRRGQDAARRLHLGQRRGVLRRPRRRNARRNVGQRRRFPRAALPRWEHRGAARRSAGPACRAAANRRRPGPGRGALARMLPPFEIGLGGPIGSGKQYLPWIHLHDFVKIITVALLDDRYRGPVNGVAPEQATSRSFARALGRALHRPAMLPLPALALKAIFGQAATVLLASQRVVPLALKERQFAFDFPTLAAALEDIVGGAAVTISPAQSRPDGAGAARYELRTSDGGRCAACGDVRVLLESREPRPDHAGRDEVFHPGEIPPMATGRGDRLSRPRRSAAGAMAYAYHELGAGSTLCRSSGGGPVPPLVARAFVSRRRRAHRHGGSRVLHAATRDPRPAGQSTLHRRDAEEDLSVPRRRDSPPIWSVVGCRPAVRGRVRCRLDGPGMDGTGTCSSGFPSSPPTRTRCSETHETIRLGAVA